MPQFPAARRFTRRQFIGATLAAGLGGTALLRGPVRPARAELDGNHHLVWVWQFSTDSEPNDIGARLRDHHLGVILKTHDGVEWMAKYDSSRFAVTGPAQVQVLAQYFEGAGVPFHAWCVVHGSKPREEARMAAAVLHSGARSIFLDVEPHAGFWRGTAADALAFGQELRLRAPDAEVALSIDARPWLRDAIPLREFAGFVNSIAPQHYWLTFDTQANYDKYRRAGFAVPPEGVTPEFLLSTTQAVYGDLGLPLHHTGQGATNDAFEWHRFVDSAFSLGTDFVSAWRFGVTPLEVLDVLRAKPAKQPPAPVALSGTHVVQAGESLSLIAANYGTTVDALVEANGLSDPNYVYVGQELVIPGWAAASLTSSGSSPAPPPAAPAPTRGGRSYVVQPGDTLSGIAARFGSSAGAIASANGLADPNFIYAGQQLTIP